MNKKGLTTEFKVGIFAIIALVFFVFLGIHFTRASSNIKGKTFYVVFNFLNGLQQGSSVRYSGGIIVGKVLSIEPYGDKAKLTVVVNNKITVDSRTKFSIMSNGLLGEKYINVSLGAPEPDGATSQNEPLKEGSTIIGQEDMGFDKLLSGVTALAAEMSKVMVPLAQILGKMDQTNELPKLLASLRSFVNNGNILMTDNRKSLSQILKHLQSIMSKVDKGQGTLGKILNDRVFAQSLADTIDSIDILVAKLSNNPLISSGSGNNGSSGNGRRRS